MVRRTRMSARRRDRGFTLIELLIAAALSMVGLLGLVALQTIAIRGNMMSRNFAEALGIAQQRLETMQHTTYATLASTLDTEACGSTSTDCGSTTTGLSPDPSTTSTQAIYSRCTKVIVDSANNVTTVMVRTCWKDNSAAWHAVQLSAQRSP